MDPFFFQRILCKRGNNPIPSINNLSKLFFGHKSQSLYFSPILFFWNYSESSPFPFEYRPIRVSYFGHKSHT